MLEVFKALFNQLDSMELDEKVDLINKIKLELKNHSPFASEPVDCVVWVKSEEVAANDYNPNSVAPPEMELLKVSILQDGYTQPIVGWKKENGIEVVDGFHRNRVGKEFQEVKDRVHGYLPVTIINDERSDIGDRMASTIRHNRARGKHKVESMSDIVLELKNRNWKNERIARELGMDEEEILRLCQITGLEGLFKDEDFSRAWEIGDVDDAEFIPLDDDLTEEEKEQYQFRTLNTDDPTRIFHTFDKWECQKAGFYKSSKEGMKKSEAEAAYAAFLANLDLFEDTLQKVTSEWVHSCEHYLTNKSMNRIAWLGQASVCYHAGIPSTCSSGWNLLSKEQQVEANEMALKYLNEWLTKYNIPNVTMDEAVGGVGRQVEIY